MTDRERKVWDLGEVIDFAHLAKSRGLSISTGPGDVFLSVYSVEGDWSYHIRFWHDGRVDTLAGEFLKGLKPVWMLPEPEEWRCFFGLNTLDQDALISTSTKG